MNGGSFALVKSQLCRLIDINESLVKVDWFLIAYIGCQLLVRQAAGATSVGGHLRRCSALAAARRVLEDELQSIRLAGTYKHERVIESKQAVSVSVKGVKEPLLNFCANNYLGLSVFYTFFH